MKVQLGKQQKLKDTKNKPFRMKTIVGKAHTY